ncbi:hypothetical protein B4107_3701 [Bacillus safensis]|nr:hypothetical protein B4107_3701 [Bacillus safensis]
MIARGLFHKVNFFISIEKNEPKMTIKKDKSDESLLSFFFIQ